MNFKIYLVWPFCRVFKNFFLFPLESKVNWREIRFFKGGSSKVNAWFLSTFAPWSSIKIGLIFISNIFQKVSIEVSFMANVIKNHFRCFSASFNTSSRCNVIEFHFTCFPTVFLGARHSFYAQNRIFGKWITLTKTN